jgi:hypothetical protein
MAVPAVRVFDGARLLGTTPLINAQLSAGRHRLRLVPVDHHPARMVTVSIRSGETTRLAEHWP